MDDRWKSSSVTKKIIKTSYGCNSKHIDDKKNMDARDAIITCYKDNQNFTDCNKRCKIKTNTSLLIISNYNTSLRCTILSCVCTGSKCLLSLACLVFTDHVSWLASTRSSNQQRASGSSANRTLLECAWGVASCSRKGTRSFIHYISRLIIIKN